MNYPPPTHIEVPDQVINPPDIEDFERKLTPSEIVGAFMNGEDTIDLEKIDVHVLASDFKYIVNILRFFKADPTLSSYENVFEKMSQLNEGLHETFLGYIEE